MREEWEGEILSVIDETERERERERVKKIMPEMRERREKGSTEKVKVHA